MANAKGSTNWFVVGVSTVVVVVLAGLAALVVWLNASANSPGTVPESAIVDTETGGISFGDGEDTVDVFVDFMCPICNSFEQQYGEQLQDAADAGDITLRITPVSILDRFSQGTEYSTRAAGAAYCVANEAPDNFRDFFDLLFVNQPQENTPGLSDEDLVGLAEQAGADAAADCITEGTYHRFAQYQADHHEIQGTPSIDINGERLDLQAGEIAKLEELIGIER